MERPTGGPARKDGRRLGSNGKLYAGIDINSSVAIDIDRWALSTKLMRRLPSEALTSDQQNLLTVLTKLREAADLIMPAMEATKNSVDAFLAAEAARPAGSNARTAKDDVFQAQARSMGTAVRALINLLSETTEKRLLSQGLSLEAAADAREKSADQFLERPNLVLGYDWDLIHQKYADEIRYVEGKLEAMSSDIGVMIEIQGHRVARKGGAVALYLPGYSEVETGPSTLFQKIRFEVPPEQAALLESYKEIAKKTETARSFSDAAYKMASADFEVHRQELIQLFSGARGAVEIARENLKALEAWKDRAARDTWIERRAADLKKTEEGKKVLAAWAAAQQAIEDTRADFKALRAYGDLSENLKSASPETAMNLILGALKNLNLAGDQSLTGRAGFRVFSRETWQGRIATIEEFAARVEKLRDPLLEALKAEDGPVGSFLAAKTSIETVIRELNAAAPAAREYLISLLGIDPIRDISEFPKPKGQKQLGLTLVSDVSTSFDLKTIAEGREPEDEIWIRYRFLRGTQEIENSGWTDKFAVRVFGWQDKFVAGLAFAKQQSQGTWEPTATLSWLLNKRCWPKPSGDDGLSGLEGIDWFSGFGISTMPVDFSEVQSVEIGIGPTVSFLNDRLIAGYGWDLQTEKDRGFVFFSIRLFQKPGPLKETHTPPQ